MKFTLPNFIRSSAKRIGHVIWRGRAAPNYLIYCQKLEKLIVEWTRTKCGQYIFELSVQSV